MRKKLKIAMGIARAAAGVAALTLVVAQPVWAEKFNTLTPENKAAHESAWTLDQSNWQKAEGLLPDSVLKRLREGAYRFQVVPIDDQRFKQNLGTNFWAASEANEGKYDLDPETCGLKYADGGSIPDHVFGQPFPRIDPKDPLAACKIAWNFYLGNQLGGGVGATFTLNGIDQQGEFRRIKMFLHINAYLGRNQKAEVNKENLRSTQISHAMEPADADGVNILTQQLNDWTSPDRMWAFLPQSRRARRVNAATRSDPLAGLDIFSDDLNCFAGKPEYYKWQLIGEGKVLAPVIGPYALPQNPGESPTRFDVNIPYLRGGYETPGNQGAPWQITENLSMIERPVWIVEGQSTDPYYNFGKVVMRIDKDMGRIYWKDVHNRAGEFFYTAMCGYHFSNNEQGDYGVMTPNLVMGVNEKTNRAALGGRYDSQFVEKAFSPDYFSLRALSRLSD